MSATAAGVLFIVSLLAGLAALYRALGDLLFWVATSTRDLAPERLAYRLVGADPKGEQSWSAYARSVLAFSAISVLFLYAFLRVQQPSVAQPGFPGGRTATRRGTPR